MQGAYDIDSQDQFSDVNSKQSSGKQHINPNAISASDTECDMEVEGWTKLHQSAKVRTLQNLAMLLPANNRYQPPVEEGEHSSAKTKINFVRPPPLYIYRINFNSLKHYRLFARKN